MRRMAALLTALCQLALAPQVRAVFAMKTGVTLRMHVVAEDDTPAMQQVKYAVRDGVQEAYAACAASGGSMLARAGAHLPVLTDAARAAAREAGFTGSVEVRLGPACFNERTLDGFVFPAGVYPALVIRLGKAQGRNWWGLIDRELALRCAAIGPAEEGGVVWDWSAAGLWEALRALLLPEKEGL